MSKEEYEARLRDLQQEESQLRRRLSELEDKVQDAPGAHRPGAPSVDTIKTEREIRSVVLRLSDIDRQRQELTVALSLK